MKNYIEISKNNIARYELEVARSKCCGCLVPISFTEDENRYFVKYEEKETYSIEQWFNSSKSIMFDGYRMLLKLLRSIIDSLIDIQEYLIPSEHVSLDFKSIHLSEERAILNFSAVPHRFENAVSGLLETIAENYPETHADFLISKLPERYDAVLLKRKLISMEIDLHFM